MSKKKRHLKKKFKVSIILIILIVIGIFAFIKIRDDYLYKQTYEYKFLQIGYEKKEIKLLLKYLKDDKLDELLENEKDDTLLSFMNEKYYKNENLDRYLEYLKENKKESIENIINTVNLNRDYDYYEISFDADTSLENEILVNKYYLLKSDFVPSDLVDISSSYAWGETKQICKVAWEAYLNMYNAAEKEANLHLMINSAYRSYQDQEEVYNNYAETKGDYYADTIAARPGASEHQTGLALDIFELHSTSSATFKDSVAFTWLKENSYKYGFILRYPEGSENITGYSAESWHYRYVGEKLAEKLYKENITLDEYYANKKSSN